MSQLKRLTEDESLIIIPSIIKILGKTSRTRSLHAIRIVQGLNDRKDILGFSSLMTESRLRKCINIIRNKGILPIISGPNGYYVTDDTSEIQDMIISMRSRADSINAAANGLQSIIGVMPIPDALGFTWD